MSLPVRLRRWWPLFKRAHRLLTYACGVVFRLISPVLGARGVPRHASAHSRDTALAEPHAVRIHRGAPATDVPRRPTAGSPAGHWVFGEEQVAAIGETFTLEVARGRLVGDFAATITPGDVLDHETSTYFGVSDWREHPVFLRPRLGEVVRVEGTALSLTARGTASNYYHFLYDALARYGIAELCLPDLPSLSVDAIVVPHQNRYQRELLELAGIGGRLIQPRRGQVVQAERLLVPSNPNWALQAPPAMVEWLRHRLPAKTATGRPRRIFITRGTVATTRIYLEEQALMPALERLGFERIDPGTLSVQEQIDTFAEAEAIVAPHGAGLTNVTFSPPGVRVLEMFPSTYVHRGLWAICQAIGADYRYLVAPGPGGPEGPNAGIADDISIPVATVLAAVEEMLAGR